jgi:two-component system, sensor histidine kinase ChiS
MKLRISTKLFIFLLLTAIIPISILGYVGYNSNRNITLIAAAANEEVADLAMSDSTEALSQEKKVDLQARTESVARAINDILTRVEADTAELADFATYLYNNPDTLDRYGSPSTYGWTEDGVFGSIEENQNSWLMVSDLGLDGNGDVSSGLMDEIYLTEFMDVKFKSIARNNPYAVQLYINTKSQFTRGTPFIDGEYIWVNGPQDFARDMDILAFDFYYLADETHNPDRVPVWTELYWDPAGLGWLVSSVAPVYRGQELRSVVGIDVTLEKMVNEVINIQIEETGFAFLMSGSGQAIAFPERASGVLGFEGSLVGDFGNNEQFFFYLNETGDEIFKEIIARMQTGERGLATYTHPTDNNHYYFAYHPVELTNWSVGIVVPVDEVIAPAIATNGQISQNRQVTSERIDQGARALMTTFILIMGAIVVGAFPVSMVFSRTISNPVKRLDLGSRRIGAGDLTHRISIKSGDEIEELADTFNQMADDLQRKIDEIEAANEELKKLDHLKSQFISMASHELRTPLIAIQGYVELLQEGSAGEITGEQMRMLRTVSRNTTRLARIVTELLDISRIEENKLVLKHELFALAELINEVAEEQQPVFNKRRHTISLEIEPNLAPILGDRDRIVQVITNLVGNAIKYTADRGHIRVLASQDADKVHVRVQDNGIGIKPEHLDKIFSRFYEVADITKHTTGKDDFMAGGTGLGLPIVKGIVEAHGGQVWVESEYGQGSTFHVTLPVPQDADVASARETMIQTEQLVYRATEFERAANGNPAVVKANGTPKVLIIDDEEDAIVVTSRILEEHYRVIGAKTSATGLREAITNRPDLVLLDAWMPGISGYDVCRTLKGNPNTAHIPVIIFTAAAQQEDEERAQASGADAYITKPFKIDDLLGLIERFRETSTA